MKREVCEDSGHTFAVVDQQDVVVLEASGDEGQNLRKGLGQRCLVVLAILDGSPQKRRTPRRLPKHKSHQSGVIPLATTATEVLRRSRCEPQRRQRFRCDLPSTPGRLDQLCTRGGNYSLEAHVRLVVLRELFGFLPPAPMVQIAARPDALSSFLRVGNDRRVTPDLGVLPKE